LIGKQPELPEVESSRAFVLRHCGGRDILEVNTDEQGGGPRTGQFDDIVVGEGVDATTLKAAVRHALSAS
jgi:hypothetical protein